jgi:hypothetical protein
LGRKGRLTLYESYREREEYMKTRFMGEYKSALENDGVLPKVVVKMGHYHIFRGIFLGNVPTLGNFVSEFAGSNRMDSFIIAAHVIGGEPEWRIQKSLVKFGNPNGWTIIDLRPLRPFAHQKKIKDLSNSWKRRIFATDALFLIGNSKDGTYKISKGAK